MKKYIKILIFLFLLTSCKPITETAHTEISKTSEIMSTASIISGIKTKTLIPDSTFKTPEESGTPTLIPSKLSLATATSTEVLFTHVNYNNLEIETDFGKRKPAGRIILEGMSCLDLSNEITYPAQNLSYIWDLDTDLKNGLDIDETEDIRYFDISPDQKKLAYWVNNYENYSLSYQLKIVDNNGKLLFENLYSYLNWMALIGWYDDTYLMLADNYYNKESLLPPSTIDVINPSTQETLTKIDTPSFPDISNQTNGAGGWGNDYYSESVISPDHKYAVYLANHFRLNLLDLKNNEIIIEINPGTDYFDPPDWSPDSQFYVVDMHVKPNTYPLLQDEELFKVTVSGNIERLTYLTDIFNRSEIRFFHLSPNGKKIAFNLLTDQTDPEYKVAILDVDTNTVTIYNNLESYRFYDQVPYKPPVWSPDCNQIMAVVNKAEGDGYRTVLIDLKENYIVELAEDVKPVGWMASE